MTPPTTKQRIEELLKHLVEDTEIIITNDLPSLLDLDRVTLLRRVHKDQILQNLPEATQSLEDLVNRAKLEELESLVGAIDDADAKEVRHDNMTGRIGKEVIKNRIALLKKGK